MTQADICRLALGRLGEITVPDNVLELPPTGPDTPEAAACRLYFALTADEVLRSHPWNFAKSYVSIGAEVDSLGVFGPWARKHELPSDCVRVLGLNGGADFELVHGDYICCSVSGDANLEYVTRNIWPCNDGVFSEALALKLASKIAPRLRGGTGVDQGLLEEYTRLTAPLARRIDANESGRRPLRPYRRLELPDYS